MDFGRLDNSKKLKVGVAVGLLLAVVSGAYLAFAEQEPIEISSAEELQQIRNDLDGHYVLVDDIDLSHIDDFSPIGGYDSGFTGTFDGNGHTISNLTIDRPGGANEGLFFGMDGTVENLTLRDVDVTGGEAVGGLAGVSTGIITESRVTGEVNGDQRVGGLVGVAWAGEIRDSRSEANVTGNLLVGGLVGQNEPDSTVTKSSATGEVSGSDERWDGGLVGTNAGEVRDSYATGDVANGGGGLVGLNNGEVRDSYAIGDVANGGGGLVGWNDDGIVRDSYAMGDIINEGGGLIGLNNGEVRSSYAAGNVTEQEVQSVGGLIRTSDGIFEVTNSYWDINATGQNESAGGKGLKTSEMTGSAARENMEGFDFGETWRTTEEYPRLAWQTEEDERND